MGTNHSNIKSLWESFSFKPLHRVPQIKFSTHWYCGPHWLTCPGESLSQLCKVGITTRLPAHLHLMWFLGIWYLVFSFVSKHLTTEPSPSPTLEHFLGLYHSIYSQNSVFVGPILKTLKLKLYTASKIVQNINLFI